MLKFKLRIWMVIIFSILLLMVSCGDDEKSSPTEPEQVDYNEVLKSALNSMAWEIFVGELEDFQNEDIHTSGPANYFALGWLYISSLADSKAQLQDCLGLSQFSDTIFMETLSRVIDSLDRDHSGAAFHYNIGVFSREGSLLDTALIRRTEQYFHGRTFLINYADSVLDDTLRWWIEQTSYNELTCSDCSPENITTFAIYTTSYFDGSWCFPVDTAANVSQVFSDPVGGDTLVEMMCVAADVDYCEDSFVQFVDMPLGDGSFRVSLILPKDTSWPISESATPSAQRLQVWLNNAESTSVSLTLPPLKLSKLVELNSILSDVGISTIFSQSSADWYPLADSSRINVGSFKEWTRAKFSFDGLNLISTKPVGQEGMLDSTEMVMDRPFFYLVRDELTDVIIAVGRIVRPKPI